VAREWHPIRNGDLRPENVTGRSQDKAWWRCSDNSFHEWEAVIRNRAVLGNGCPYCSGFYASPEHCLLAEFPKVASYWHPTKNGELTPRNVPPMAKRSVWWKCPAGPDHEWLGPVFVASAAITDAGCPFCANRRLSVTNRLSNVYPQIAVEWHPRRNKPLTPNDVVYGTPQRFWWKCSANPLHEWWASVVARTRAGTGCPCCTLVPRSLQEILLAFELREFLPFDIEKHKVLVSQPHGPVVDVDMLLPEHNLIVEFDGSFWHRDKSEADARKGGLLRANGWRVIRLREAPLLPLHEDDVQVPPVALNPKSAADVFLQHVSCLLGLGLDLDNYLSSDALRTELKARRYALKLAHDRTPRSDGDVQLQFFSQT
jgi:hypothetical protein